MWYRVIKIANDSYDLNELNKEVRIDDAVHDIMDALSTGKELDLSSRGFKAIKVNAPVPDDYDDNITQIDVNNPRSEGDFHYYEGQALDHYQGIAFACQILRLQSIKKGMPTFMYLYEHMFYKDIDIEKYINKIQEIDQRLKELDENAINSMVRDDDFTQHWKQYDLPNAPIWNSRNPRYHEYESALNKSVEQEREICKEYAKEFWHCWSELRKVMLSFRDRVWSPQYKQLIEEFTPI